MTARNSSLDWLRAIAIVAVVNCHAASTFSPDGAYSWLQVGGHGVDLFFALSGWLIGSQLMRELRDTGTVNVTRFWLRRWLRTLPAYYAMLLFTFAWVVSRGTGSIDWRYLVFLQNYGGEQPYFSISWSLCVEEHFYLLVAPFALIAFRRRWAWLALGPILLVPVVCRNFGWFQNDAETHVVFDQCAAGVLLAAISVFGSRTWRALTRLAPLLSGAGLLAIALAVASRIWPDVGPGDLSRTGWLLACTALVLQANASPFWMERTAWRPARFIAERAYALYLTHIEALAVVNKFGELPFGVRLALTWCMALAFAEVLHRLVERPGMRMRSWFAATRPEPILTPRSSP